MPLSRFSSFIGIDTLLLCLFQDAIQAQMVIQKMSELVTPDVSGGEDALTAISENPHSMEGSMTTTVEDDEASSNSRSGAAPLTLFWKHTEAKPYRLAFLFL